MKINLRHYILIISAILCILASSGAYYFVYKQAIGQADKYVKVNKELENEDSKKQTEQDLVKTYESTKVSRAQLLSFFVKEDKVVSFIEMVEKVGDQSKTKLELSSINNDNGIIKTNISVKGSWNNVITALMIIENLPLSLNIKNVRLSTSSGLDKKSSGWELQLSIEALSIK